MTKTAPFSFHCTICVEPFDIHDRAPVVLPCGHTFLCELCSKKLTRCMECRTPLYTLAPVPNSGAPISPIVSPTDRRSYRRATFEQQQQTQKPPQLEKIPIQLPKNHVLISLIESSNTQRDSSKSSALVDNTDSDSDSDEFAVVSSMKALSAECGTYIVKERYGLPVYSENKDGSINTAGKPHTVLLHGQKVQIVSVKDGIYKLARGIGSIFASSSQIVKSKFRS